ncbi:MAG TPA: sugar phosphate isomerase/epimerase family protein [Candidatus Methanoculleus thermohydrogenotrophicum]|jgi:sugar phosphate isomerase/epimerase|nr:sugar phosphate isomerase/epimerase family protein [Candidatus Methanoculleus thermohydrogenotrophicum]NLM82203.1 sugar phosphate isomerase/epimerase [Candidatus Methanoculleus thermohydrogenotrophicum]HOB18951.1 sugar phosphate isomerase/epimerase family protein [Candidatus Methanoculleus thermohydrogenotrophicum]HPZ39001.1 sugar phosphate isomerase/epimerase family protein [Candidatus Methanoculleus thermohydrogenotrophicum]HQC92098.1 sugar phosphate isomerase/epimerase family protein [Can
MFGVSTYCLHREPLPVALERLALITDCVEVMDEGLHYLESVEPLESYSFLYFIHAPSRGVNIASILEPIRRASVEVLTQTFSIAAEIGADVVIHPGYYAWRQEQELAMEKFRQSLGELTVAASELSVTFFVENMANWEYFFLRYPDDLPLINGIGLALDVGHAHLNGCLDAFLAHPAVHFHLHDNDGTEDSHDPVGTGTINFVPVMDAVRRNNVIPIVEVSTFEGVTASIAALEEIDATFTKK